MNFKTKLERLDGCLRCTLTLKAEQSMLDHILRLKAKLLETHGTAPSEDVAVALEQLEQLDAMIRAYLDGCGTY